jgi:hypothetical protein
MAVRLRVFPTPDESRRAAPEPTVRVSLADLLPLVATAQRHHHTWLQDFLDDEVCITEDLYEILHAFRCYRPSA